MPKYMRDDRFVQDGIEEEGDLLPTSTPTAAEDESWKKRYGDLRRHASAKETAAQTAIDELKRQNAELMTTAVKLPKNEHELADFYKQFPDGAAFIETIAAKIADRKATEMGEKVGAQIKDLEVARHATVKERAYAALLKKHGDFEQIIIDPTFKAWIEKQPKRIQDSLFENDTDPDWAARTLDMYKLETQGAVVRKSTKTDLGAAAHVGSTSGTTQPTATGDGKKLWKESEIKALSEKQYELVEAEIDKANREGRIVLDLKPPRR